MVDGCGLWGCVGFHCAYKLCRRYLCFSVVWVKRRVLVGGRCVLKATLTLLRQPSNRYAALCILCSMGIYAMGQHQQEWDGVDNSFRSMECLCGGFETIIIIAKWFWQNNNNRVNSVHAVLSQFCWPRRSSSALSAFWLGLQTCITNAVV